MRCPTEAVRLSSRTGIPCPSIAVVSGHDLANNGLSHQDQECTHCTLHDHTLENWPSYGDRLSHTPPRPKVAGNQELMKLFAPPG